MARRALSFQCRIITAVVLLAMFAALIASPDQSSTTSARFRYGRDAQAVNMAVLSDEKSSDSSSNVSHGLAKRMIAPMCDVETAVRSVARGCELTNLMFATQAEVMLRKGPSAVSRFVGKDATGSSGWKRVTDNNYNPTPHTPYLIGLDNVEEFQVNVRIAANQNWAHSTYTQEKMYTRVIGGIAHGHASSLGIHEQISSAAPNAQAIIILNALEPKFMISKMTGEILPDDELPLVGRWSDIGYIEYARTGGIRSWTPQDSAPLGRPDLARAPPRWFVLPAIWGPVSSLEIVSHCLFSYGLINLPSWQNRVTYPIGSFCFEAILGTPHGSDLAWFLITHKFRIGDTTLASVTIFGSGIIGIDGYELPSMLWWAGSNYKLTPRRQNLAQIRADNYAYSLEPGYNPGAMPHMLRPV